MQKFARTSKLKQVVVNEIFIKESLCQRESWFVSAPSILTSSSTARTAPKEPAHKKLPWKDSELLRGAHVAEELHSIVSSYFASTQVRRQDILGSCPCLQPCSNRTQQTFVARCRQIAELWFLLKAAQAIVLFLVEYFAMETTAIKRNYETKENYYNS